MLKVLSLTCYNNGLIRRQKEETLHIYDSWQRMANLCVHICGLIMYRRHQIGTPGGHEKLVSWPRPYFYRHPSPFTPPPLKKYGLARKTSHVPKQNGTYCTHTLKMLKCRLYFYSKLNYFVLGIP